LASTLTLVAQARVSGQLILQVSDLDGSAARVAAPVSAKIDLADLLGERVSTGGTWCLSEIADEKPEGETAPLIEAQFEPESPRSKRGTLWWIMPPGGEGERQFALTRVKAKIRPRWQVEPDSRRQCVDVIELAAWEPRPGKPKLSALRYNQGNVPVPEGTHPHFAPGESYERGDYIHPLFGPHGEELTDDYPKDHPHHRGVWWSWPVTRWNDQVADIWAVSGVWARPVGIHRVASGRVFSVIEAENVWKFGKAEEPIVREEVLIRTFPQTEGCRFVDVEVRLTALADGVAIGGRPKRGYGGFSLRAAPCEEREITLHTDPEDASPRRAWIDYSGVFAGGMGKSGVALFEHVDNPDYPNPLHEYPQCNCVMPAYPDAREVPLSKDKPLVLKHRLWVHTGGPDEGKLADVWASYANPPKVTIARQ
jgi:hypothetical protein